MFESCEQCNPAGSEIPFDCILDRITVADPSVTDYILEVPAKRPHCGHDILERRRRSNRSEGNAANTVQLRLMRERRSCCAQERRPMK